MAFSALEALQAFGAGREMAFQDRTRARQEQTRTSVGERVRAGDYGGATSAAIEGGEYNLAGSLRQLGESQREQALQEAQLIGSVATQLRALPMEQRQSSFAALMPQLRQSGYFSDDELGAVDLSDAGLDGYTNLGRSALSILSPRGTQQQPPSIQREVDYYRSIGRNDEAEQLLRNHASGSPVVFDINGDGAPDLVPRSYFNGGQPTPQPSGGGQMTPAQINQMADEAIRSGADPAAVNARRQQLLQGGQSPGSGNFPRRRTGALTIERNNNPGAIRVAGSTEFRRFSSPEEGIRAQESLLRRRYLGRGLRTVADIVETYAPRRSRGGDNTDAQVNNYITHVSRRLGIRPGQMIDPARVPELAAAMREFETGRR